MSLKLTLYILAASIVVPSTIGLILYRKLLTPAKIVTLLLVLGMLTETIMIVFSIRKTNNLFALHFYALAEIALLSVLFYKLIEHKAVQKIILIGATALGIFAIIYGFVGNNISDFNSVPRAIESIYFSFLSCWLFYEMSDYKKTVYRSEYIIIGTVMFYFSSCFVIFAFNKYVTHATEALIAMIVAHSIVNALCNLSYATGIWAASK